MGFRRLEVKRDGAVLHVDLDRPERLNALDTTALQEIVELFTGLQGDFDARIVVLGGRGRSFCSGADRKDPPGSERGESSSGATQRERRFVAQLGRRACDAIQVAEVITIARVQGHAIGGGFALALACDFRIAARDAVFQVPEVDLGIPLTWGATPRLIHEVGAARAREVILLCDPIGAEQAERWGLIHRAVEPGELERVADDWARRLAAKPEVAVHMTKTQFRAYAARAVLGDVTETDGDILRGALRVSGARGSSAAK
jgi:enoyl-CoA hydratase/carnithine racemase